MTPIQYIRNKGFEYKIQSNQAVLKVCPFCGDSKYHFYMDQTEGAFFCHKCQERGNLITLQKHFGDFEPRRETQHTKPQGNVKQAFPEQGNGSKAALNPERAVKAHERLLRDPQALNYVTEIRGLSLETVKSFKLGLEVDQAGKWITIPHYQGNKLVNIKFRSLPPAEKTFRRVANCKSVLFNGDILQERPATVYLCEGEIDALALWDRGEKSVVGATTGAGSFDPSWVDQLQDVQKIIIVYDSDDAGQKGAREVARRLGYDRCYNVVLPDGQDVNDYFNTGYSIADFIGYVAENARQFDIAGIMTFEDGLKRLLDETEKPDRENGVRTGFIDVDRIIRAGFLPGELVVLSAPPKIGKSTWALQVCTHNALQRIPSLFFCLEMRPTRIIEKVVKCETKKESIRDTEIIITQQAFKGKPFYLGYANKKPTIEGIMSTLKTAIRRYGLKLIVFDHLHFLCRSITNQVQEIGQAVQAFKFLAEELEIPIILIAQPRKIQADSIMTAMDLKDSSSIFSDCDHLIILHRARRRGDGGELVNEAFDPVTMVRIEASRYGAGGEALLYFHGGYSRFDEIESHR